MRGADGAPTGGAVIDAGAGLALALAGEPVRLLAGRALHWPGGDALLIADLHLGKGDAFRRAGLAVPRGGTAADLARLGALLDASGAGRLLVLGDVVHGAVHRDAGWLADWQAWRAARPGLRLQAIAGNHDRHLAPDALGIEALPARVDEGPFAFVHDEADAAGATGYVLAGHLHPVVRLPGLGRLPAFALGPRGGLLPAFSAFTGGVALPPAGPRALYACAPGAVLAVPGAGPR